MRQLRGLYFITIHAYDKNTCIDGRSKNQLIYYRYVLLQQFMGSIQVHIIGGARSENRKNSPTLSSQSDKGTPQPLAIFYKKANGGGVTTSSSAPQGHQPCWRLKNDFLND